ncbi:trehalose-phosphatase [Roseococcus thiosulfatophilus]|uniref:trehalose-phosphatase n=1 Tax=Roseococcus thiosulfatophilus TaxID=35813 RepID=UPI001A8C2704|nr:trehalose-phosphatase [Roseococcus thiosulfatophilus]
MTTNSRPPSAIPGPTDVLSRAALLLDMDGTLLDLAPRPDEVVVAPGLLDHLTRLHAALGGAVAVVTGRRLDDVDRILHPLRLPAAAEHGAILRPSPDAPPRQGPLRRAPAEWRAAAEAFVAAHPGTLLEPKSAGFVLHYRLAPDRGAEAHALMRGFAESGQGFDLLRADHAWELRPGGVHKGVGVRALMAEAPFAGRWPIFIGDDVTDEDGIAAAVALGGEGFLVPDSFGTPAGVRAWIATLAEHAHAPAP